MNYTQFKKEWEVAKAKEKDTQDDKVYANILNDLAVVRL